MNGLYLSWNVRVCIGCMQMMLSGGIYKKMIYGYVLQKDAENSVRDTVIMPRVIWTTVCKGARIAPQQTLCSRIFYGTLVSSIR